MSSTPPPKMRPNSKLNVQPSRLAGQPRSDCRLSSHAYSAKVKWEAKHGKPCPYALSAREGGVCTLWGAKVPHCRAGADNNGPEGPPLSRGQQSGAGAKCCDFGSGFNRDFDNVKWQESFFYFEREAVRRNKIGAASVPGVAGRGAASRGGNKRKDANINKPGRRRRAPTLLEIHQHVIDAAVLELSRPREKPFENLGERLGGEHVNFTYCDGSTKLPTTGLPDHTVQRCSSAETNTRRASKRVHDRPSSQNNARRRAPTADTHHQTVLPRFERHEPWKIPLLRGGPPTDEGSMGSADASFGGNGHAHPALELPHSSEVERKDQTDISLAPYLKSRGSVSANRRKQQPVKAKTLGMRESKNVDSCSTVEDSRLSARAFASAPLLLEAGKEIAELSAACRATSRVANTSSAVSGQVPVWNRFGIEVPANQTAETTALKDKDANRKRHPSCSTAHKERPGEQDTNANQGHVANFDFLSINASNPLSTTQVDCSLTGVDTSARTGDTSNANIVQSEGELVATEAGAMAKQNAADVVLMGTSTRLAAASTGSSKCANAVKGESGQSLAVVVMSTEASAVAKHCVNEVVSHGLGAHLVSATGSERGRPVTTITDVKRESAQLGAAVMVTEELSVTAAPCVNRAVSPSSRVAATEGGEGARPETAVVIAANLRAMAVQCIDHVVSQAVRMTLLGTSGNNALSPKHEGAGLEAANEAATSSAIAVLCVNEIVAQAVHARQLSNMAGEASEQPPEASPDGSCNSLTEKANKGRGDGGAASKQSHSFGKDDNSVGSSATTQLSSESSAIEFVLHDSSSTTLGGPSETQERVGQAVNSTHEVDSTTALSTSSWSGGLLDDSSVCSQLESACNSPVEERHPLILGSVVATLPTTTVKAWIDLALSSAVALSVEAVVCEQAVAPTTAGLSTCVTTRRAIVVANTAATLAEIWIEYVVKKVVSSSAPPTSAETSTSSPRLRVEPRNTAATDGTASADHRPACCTNPNDSDQQHTLGASLGAAQVLPLGFLDAIVARRASLKPVTTLSQNPGGFALSELRRKEEGTEAEAKARGTEWWELEVLMHTEGLDQYAPYAFARGVMYGEGKTAVVYRVDARLADGGEKDVPLAETAVGKVVAAMAMAVTLEVVATSLTAACTTTIKSVGAATEPTTALMAASMVTSVIAESVALVTAATVQKGDERKTFAAKEFQYTRPDVPLSILRDARREVRMHLRVRDCRHVVALCGVWLTPRVTLLFEPMEGGNLHRFIRDHGKHKGYGSMSTPLWATRFIAEVADGLVALHRAGIVHRDVKSHNVLIVRRRRLLADDLDKRGCNRINNTNPVITHSNSDGTDGRRCGGGESEWEAKLGDLGSAALIPPEGEAALTEEAGTSGWVAPEIFGGEGYGTPADIFSLGILLWETFVSGPVDNPLCGLSGDACRKALREGLRPPLSPVVPGEVQSLLERCWAFEPGDRPTADAVAAELRAFVAASPSAAP